MILHRAIRVIRKPSKMRKLRNGLGRSFHFIWVSSAGANLFFLSFSSLFSRKSKEINIFVRRLNFCRPVHQSDKTSMNIVEPAQMGQKRHRRKKRQTESECILSIPYSIVYIANLYRSKVSFFSFSETLDPTVMCVSLYISHRCTQRQWFPRHFRALPSGFVTCVPAATSNEILIRGRDSHLFIYLFHLFYSFLFPPDVVNKKEEKSKEKLVILIARRHFSISNFNLLNIKSI